MREYPANKAIQPFYMTVAGDEFDSGHWYSPDAMRAAVAEERERCAMLLSNVTRADVSLVAGELSAQEWRTCAAVLRWMQSRIMEETMHG